MNQQIQKLLESHKKIIFKKKNYQKKSPKPLFGYWENNVKNFFNDVGREREESWAVWKFLGFRIFGEAAKVGLEK